MAEIKSTLDLVMERTRNLTLSAEEKQAQKQKDAQKILNGVIQKYLDQLITPEEIALKISAVEQEYQLEDRSLFVDVILDKIDLEALHGPLPALLEDIAGVDVSGLFDLAGDHQRQLTEGRQSYFSEAMCNLSDQAGISGSAVLPNVEADLKWQGEIRSRMAVLETALLQEKNKLKVDLCTP
jgi:hypothetical protein